MNELNTNEKQAISDSIEKNKKVENKSADFVMKNSSDSNYADVEIKSNGEVLGKTRLMFF